MMLSIEWMFPRPVRWLMDRGWAWMAAKVLPEGDDALADLGDVLVDGIAA